MSVHKKVIFDDIHGYITLNRVEVRVLQSAYYQRLRWIKQLGFTFYIFPGATHTRFSHTLGVLHVMDKILKAIGKASPEEKFFDPNANDSVTMFHRTMRLAAMLHDIGTFPFSHTMEIAYLEHWRKQTNSILKKTEASHEVLGAHILNNTDFEGGITRILKEEGIDPKELSQIIAGKSNNMLANQLMHSDMDADRMDYLIRDSYNTGVKYGQYDQDYLIQNLTVTKYKNQEVLAIHEHALNIVEYFLICRYSWYSQIIANGTGYKFDLLAAKIYEYFLEMGQVHSFKYLMEGLSQEPNRFFTFHDSYFMAMVSDYLAEKVKHPVIHELCQMLAYRIAPKHFHCYPIVPTLIQSPDHREEVYETAKRASYWLEAQAKEISPHSWMIIDMPKKDVTFMSSALYGHGNGNGNSYGSGRGSGGGSSYGSSGGGYSSSGGGSGHGSGGGSGRGHGNGNGHGHRHGNGGGKKEDPLLVRDPVKVLTTLGDLREIVDVPNSIIKVLRNYRNFIPRIYTSPKTFELLEKKGVLKSLQHQFKANTKKSA